MVDQRVHADADDPVVAARVAGSNRRGSAAADDCRPRDRDFRLGRHRVALHLSGAGALLQRAGGRARGRVLGRAPIAPLMWQPKRAVAKCVVSVLATSWIAGSAVRPGSVLIVFPLLVATVAIFAVVLTWLEGGLTEVRAIFAEIRLTRDRLAWLAVVLVPPALIFCVLELLARVSSVFVPNLFLIGILFGLFPGLVEEIGWTGFA